MKLFLTSFLVLSLLTLFAQQPVSFSEQIHDFGTIEESRQPYKHRFSFINETSDTLKINNVKASCGCTTPSWTREMIAPGDSGFVVAQYNSYNRPGSFNKSLRIYWSSGQQQPIYIKGKVNPRVKSPAEAFPAKIGSLRTKYMAFNVGNITTQKTIARSFDLYNDGGDTLVLLSDQHKMPSFAVASFESEVLPPQRKSKVTFSIDPEKIDRLGFTQYEVTLATNDADVPMKNYQLYVTLQEYFAPLSSEEKELAPMLMFDVSTVDFGTMSAGSIMEKKITITNTGQNPLNIRQISTNCDCVVAKTKKEDIKSGKSIELTLSFYSSDRKGRQYKTVTVFSNDPMKPTQTIAVKANVN